jgi:hypothetical protein
LNSAGDIRRICAAGVCPALSETAGSAGAGGRKRPVIRSPESDPVPFGCASVVIQ